MTLRGNIDAVVDGHILGWVYDEDDPYRVLNVAAVAGETAIAAGRANLFREDLEEKGIGNGKHGFSLEVPAYILKKAQIRILEGDTLWEITGSPIDKRFKSVEALNANDPIIMLDATGIISHLHLYDILSGISRAEAEILKAFYRSPIYNFHNLKFVTIDPESMEFKELDKQNFIEFLDDYQLNIKLGKFSRSKDGVLDINRYLKFNKITLCNEEYRQVVIVELGASWTLPYYIEYIKSLKVRGAKFIPLLQDILALKFHDLHVAGVYHTFQIYLRKMLSYADAILAGSENTKRDIIAFAQENRRECPPVFVGKNGVTRFSRAKQLPPGISRPFALIVSTLEVRKNHILAVRAWQHLYKKYGQELPDLVFVGQWGWKVQDLAHELEICDYLDGHIKILNNIQDDDLAALYNECLFTIYPSRYEGWGLPVAESLSAGKVCLCSNTSSLPEVGLDFCLYFNPDDFTTFTSLAERLLYDTKWRAELENRIRGEYRPVEWTEVAKAIAESARLTISLPAREPILTMDGSEYAFYDPPMFCTPQPHAFAEAINFRMPQMALQPRSWDSYACAEELIVNGRYSHPDANGIIGSLHGNEFRFKLPEYMSQGAIIYMIISSEEESGRIEVLSGRNVVLTSSIKNTEMCLCFDSEKFQRGNEVSYAVRPITGGRIRFRTFLAVAKDNLDARLGALERLCLGQRKIR